MSLTLGRWLAALSAVVALGGHPLLAQNSPLDDYVAEGLRQNLRLSADRMALQRSGQAVREADGRWLPSLTLNARYSERSGDLLDLGRLVNPAYAALNQLIGQPAFPTDLSLRLPMRQETSLRLTQPLFEPRVVAGSAIARDAESAVRAQTAEAIRRLAAQIRLAYLDYARASRVEDLHRATLELLGENLRINQSLADHGAATPDAILRAHADLSEGEQRLADAGRMKQAARESFNLLLERPLEDSLELAPDSSLGLGLTVSLDSAVALGLHGREELAQLDAAIGVAEGKRRLASAAFLPSLVAAVDYGMQGEVYRVGGSHDYLVASLVLQWNLFNGGQDQARRNQARLEAEEIRAQRAATERLVTLEVRTDWQAARVAGHAIASANDRLGSAERNYTLVERKYREGAATQVELIDARTSFTAAQLNRILTTYDYFSRCVELERAAALYPADPIIMGVRHAEAS